MKGNAVVQKSGTGLAIYIPSAVVKKLNIQKGNRLDMDIDNPDPDFIHPPRRTLN